MSEHKVIVRPQVTQVKVAVTSAGTARPAPSNFDLWLQIEGNAGKSLEEYQESLKGTPGLSDFAIWLAQDGNAGKSYDEYRETLKGAPAPSNYALWRTLEGNADKSLEEYLDSIKGPAGPSNYQLWLQIEGNEGKSFDEYQETLKGDSGPSNFDLCKQLEGNSGKSFEEYQASIKGDAGLSAYQLWLEQQGNSGKSFEEYQETLKAVAPVFTFSGEDFFLIGSKFYRRNLIFGSLAEPLTGPLPDLFSGDNPGAKGILIYQGDSSPFSAPYAPEAGSLDFDADSINVVNVTWISAELILYKIVHQITIPAENLLKWSNKFNEFTTWQQVNSITRATGPDDSWTITLPAGGTLYQTYAAEASAPYTFSIDIKSCPADLTIGFYSNPGWNETEYTDIASELTPDEFTRISKVVETVPGSTSMWVMLSSAAGGEVVIRHAQLNTGNTPKPYVLTTG